MAFSSEQLNFFKFFSLVLDVFPVALRKVFVFMWDTLVATSASGVPKWDDSVTVLNIFQTKEGGVKKLVPTLNKSYKEWDCTGLFRATLFAQTFAMPDGSGGLSTLDKLYVKPRGLSPGTFHPSVISPTGNTAETYALALDQLRLLRNTLCHQISTRKIDKATFDQYILLAKDTFTVLGQDAARIDDIGKLNEDDFPTAKLQQVEDELKREKDTAVKFKQLDDHLDKIESQVKDVGSDVKDVKTEVTDVKTQLEDVRSDVKELKANVVDIKQTMQAENSKGPLVPDSCIPDKIPHFVGRQEECQAILNHFKDGNTRLINVWGPPGFGKTSVAINVAHHLETPVYFASLRGMKRKDDLVSRLLSIFTDAKQTFHVSPSHWLIQSLQQLQNPFVLILDNADDVLESGDAKLKEDVLRFIEDILAQCNHIKLLLTTRESLNYLSHKRPIHLERVGVLDEVASGHLVKSLFPNVSGDDCSSIVKACGQVPLAMRLMCSTVTEEHVLVNELLEELNILPLVEVLDNESFPDDSRLKTIINTSFQRLTANERDAFVSLAVFPGCFGIGEAMAVLNLKTVSQTKKMIGSLKQKSLIDCSGYFEAFTIHSLLRSFVEEKRITDQTTEAVFVRAQHRFYSYQISSFGMANEQFLTGHSNEGLVTFLRQRESILLSLTEGLRDDELYREAVEVLSKAELFLFSILPDEESSFQKLYDTAVNEAQKRKNVDDERTLLASKSFSHWGWFSDGQTWDHSLQAGYTDAADCPAKLLCYHGIHQILCGELDEGMSSLKSSVDRLGSSCDETVLKLLACQVLAVSHWRKQEHKKTADFVHLCKIEARAGLESVGIPFSLSLKDAPVHHDAFLFFVTSNLIFFTVKRKKNDQQLHHAIAALSKEVFSDEREFSMERIKQASTILSLVTSGLKEFELITDELEVTARESLHSFNDLIDQLSPDSVSAMTIFNKALTKLLYFCENIFSFIGKIDGQVFNNYFLGLCKQPIKEMEIFLKSHENNLDFEVLARSYDLYGKILHLMNDYSGAMESHQQAIRIRAEKNSRDHVDTASSLTSIGCAYFKLNNEIEAVKSFQSALEMRKQLGIYDHADTANIYHTLGENHFSLDNCEKAIEAHLQASKLREKHLKEHPRTAESLHDIAVVYCRMSEKGIHSVKSCRTALHAETPLEFSFCEEALAMRLELLDEHVDTADSYHTIGSIFYNMGDHHAAAGAFQKALDMKSNLRRGADHNDTAWSYFWLGKAQYGDQLNREALQSLKKARQMRKNCSLGDDPNMADIIQEKGCVYYTVGEYQSAKKQFHAALDLYKKLPDKHGNTANSCHALSVAYLATKNYTEALEFCQQALTMRLELLGEHRQTADSFHILGAIHYEMGDDLLAIKELQKASNMRSNVLRDHKDTAQSYHLLGTSQYNLDRLNEAAESFHTQGVIHYNMGDYPSAIEAVQKASNMMKDVLGDHPSTAESFHLLGLIHYEMSDYLSAIKALQTASDMRSNLLGDHKDTAAQSYYWLGASQYQYYDTNTALGTLVLRVYHLNGALASLQKASRMMMEVLEDHPSTAESFHALGRIHYDKRDYPSAIQALQKASDMRSNVLGDHKDTAESYHWLGKAQHNKRDLDGALESLQKASQMREEVLGRNHPSTAESLELLNRVRYEASDWCSIM